VPAGDRHCATRERQCASDELGELAIADDEDARVATDLDLLLDLERSRERFGEERPFCRKLIRNDVQVLLRQGEELRHRSVPPDDAEDGAMVAVGGASGSTGVARVTDRIDLAHDAPPSLGHADELMPRYAGERVVAARHFDVGIADPGSEDANDDLSGRGDRFRDVLPEAQGPVFQPESAHPRIVADWKSLPGV